MAQILIIDDDKTFLKLFTRSIQKHYPGLEVICYSDPVQALPEISADLALLLLDLEMPGLDGTKLLHYAREKGLSKNRIIILSARDADYLHEKFPMGACLAVLNKHEVRQQAVLKMILSSVQAKR